MWVGNNSHRFPRSLNSVVSAASQTTLEAKVGALANSTSGAVRRQRQHVLGCVEFVD